MSAHDPQDQKHAPSVRDLLAASAAARAVSTPPSDAAQQAAPKSVPGSAPGPVSEHAQAPRATPSRNAA